MLESKFVKFLISVLKWLPYFSLNRALFFIVMIYISSVIFKVIPFRFWTKGCHESPNFDTSKCSGGNLQISHVIFQTTSQFFLKFSTTLQCHESWLLCTFVAQTLYTLVTMSQLKHNFFRFLSALVKIREIPNVNFKTTSQSSSIFVSFFIVMTHNSSVNFKVIHFQLSTKGSHQSSNFDSFECSGENLPNSSCHFPNHMLVFLQILYHSSMSSKITTLLFLAQTIHNFLKRSPLKWTFLSL